MRACLVVGYGSIGKRHVQILKNLGCRVSIVTSQKIEDNTCYATIKEALEETLFDYVIIANPTYLHYSALTQLIKCNYQGVVLIEKPLFFQVERLPENKIQRILVAYNLRFHELLQQANKLIKDQKLITFSAYVGQYLPTWRMGVDYRECYSARKEQGGGVLRDLSHELDYTLWLCGACVDATAVNGHFSHLEINSDDTCSIMMKCTRCPVVNVQVNYLDRFVKREITINTDQHTIFIDFIKEVLTIDGEMQTTCSQEMQKTYVKQHQAVMNEEFDHCCSYSEGLSVMKLIDAAEKASAAQMWVSL